MDARAKSVREILHSGDQYLIPFFQRHYSWRRKNWERLRADLWNLMEDDKATSLHFLGPLVCTPAGHVPGEVPAYQLIDGQQRLTTLTLLLAAIRDVAREQGLDDLGDEVMEDYLVHKRKKGLQRYKVVPRLGDREILMAVLEAKIEKQHHKEGITQAWQYFRQRISEWSSDAGEESLRRLFVAATERLSLVVITIDGENPYEIFESLNSTGLPLEESDLIRNYLFMQVPIAEQEEFNASHWSALEKMFDESGEYPAIPQTLFYRNYLMRNGVYSKSRFTFVDFKEHNRERELTPEVQVEELQQYAGYELQLRRPATVESPELRRAFAEIAMLEITTAHPLLHNLMNRAEDGALGEADLLGCLQDLASFVVRRSICGESTRNYGRWFCEAAAAISNDPRSDLRKYWMRRGWPDDESFMARLVEFPIYRRESKKCRLILERLEESYGHKEKVDVSTLSIEHVMPQTVDKGKHAKAWQLALGDSWQVLHERKLHTLGNLTLSGYNPSLSNRPFVDKKVELAKSNLVLNRWFVDVEDWNPSEIDRRGRTLAEQVATIWARPQGGDYTPPVEDKPKKLSAAERREHHQTYWKSLLTVVEERDVFKKLPRPARRGVVGFPIGVAGFRLIAFVNLNKRYIGTALVCRGPKARENFEKLGDQRTAIEEQLGPGLLWQEAATASTSRIALRLGDADPLDTNTWTKQHTWLADKLQAFAGVFADRCEQVSASDSDQEDRLTRRHRFWQTLLERAENRTDLHKSISAGHEGWISTGAGWSGFSYVYVVAKNKARVEIYIQRGKGAKQENKSLFDALKKRRKTIEEAFGENLSWQRLDNRSGCRIACPVDVGGYRSDESEWPAIQDAMIDAMIRLEKATSSEIARLKSRA